jgi:hypothetical protein
MARIAAVSLLTAAALALPSAAAADFTPTLTATVGTADQPSKVGAHPPFTTVVSQPDGQPAIKKAVVTLPSGLFANIDALQTLCPVAAQADALGCPAGSRVGSVNVVSPLVPGAITGPVYVAESPTGGLPGLTIALASGGVAGVLPATNALAGNRLQTTLDNLPNTPVSSFGLTIDGGQKGLFTVGDALCAQPVVDAMFTSYDGQTVTQSAPVNIVGTCVPAPVEPAAAAPAVPVATAAPSTAKPSLVLGVRGVRKTPAVTLRARSAPGAAKLSSVRLKLPAGLSFVRARLARGLVLPAGATSSLGRDGALTVRAPRGGLSAMTVTIRSGAVRASRTLRSRRALPRLTFLARVTDVANASSQQRLAVRPRA